MNDFLTHLPDGAVDVVLAAAAQRRYLMNRCRLVTPLVPRLLEETIQKLVADLEAAPRDLGPDELERTRTLVAAAHRIGDERERVRILDGVLARAEGPLPSWYVFGPALLDMLGFAPEEVRRRAVAAALDLCVAQYTDGDPEALIARLHGNELPEALERLRTISDVAKRRLAVAAVLRRAGEVGGRDAVPGLPVLTAWPAATVRADLFTLVAASAWWIRDAAGADGVHETVKAILDVSRWWR
ncbi:hypothetical protein ACFFX1_34030 [Dactylosporangium sucinum]|uniref:Uncharacterized protein n=1 Tax=Dactylosporangium sucinum TaxID=1424081 RepID=A0A917UFL6_9ACTN|nr:hypothetical protein [Dactylosporangium sucinum]GGM88838.1 hypothetical protein GCM10007977_108570 [Dactylosporangium sucinum]